MCTASKQEWTHIHAGARCMWGDKLGVPCDGHVDGFEEELFRRGRHGDEGGAVLHSARVHGGAEEVDTTVIWGAEGFEALVALLAVVEAWGEAVDREVGRDDEFGGSPDAGVDAVVGLDVAVDFADAEADVGPVWWGLAVGRGRGRGRGRRGVRRTN